MQRPRRTPKPIGQASLSENAPRTNRIAKGNCEWTPEEVDVLLKFAQEQSSDTEACNKRIDNINWKLFKGVNRSAEECKEQLKKQLWKTMRSRTLAEVVSAFLQNEDSSPKNEVKTLFKPADDLNKFNQNPSTLDDLYAKNNRGESLKTEKNKGKRKANETTSEESKAQKKDVIKNKKVKKEKIDTWEEIDTSNRVPMNREMPPLKYRLIKPKKEVDDRQGTFNSVNQENSSDARSISVQANEIMSDESKAQKIDDVKMKNIKKEKMDAPEENAENEIDTSNRASIKTTTRRNALIKPKKERDDGPGTSNPVNHENSSDVRLMLLQLNQFHGCQRNEENEKILI